MLSRIIFLSPTGPVVMKLIPNLLLLNSCASTKLSIPECHYMAALSFYTTSLDPLSVRMMEIRLRMAGDSPISEERVLKEFFLDRIYKIGVPRVYTWEEASAAYGMSVEKYRNFVESIHLRGSRLICDLNSIQSDEL